MTQVQIPLRTSVRTFSCGSLFFCASFSFDCWMGVFILAFPFQIHLWTLRNSYRLVHLNPASHIYLSTYQIRTQHTFDLFILLGRYFTITFENGNFSIGATSVVTKRPKTGAFLNHLSSHVHNPPTILVLRLGLVADGRSEARLYFDQRQPLLQKLVRLEF